MTAAASVEGRGVAPRGLGRGGMGMGMGEWEWGRMTLQERMRGKGPLFCFGNLTLQNTLKLPFIYSILTKNI